MLKKPNTWIWILIVVYAVGAAGLILPETRAYVQKVVWINVLLSFVVLFSFHKKWSKEFIWSSLLILFCGYLLEVLGVKTGYVFGYYNYGNTLGYSFWETPVLIGFIWLMCIYITRNIAELITKEPVLISITGAVLMVGLDYFLEPFAVRFGLWSWNSGFIPKHNYIGWFISAFVFHYLYLKSCKFALNKISAPLYFIQLAFFLILYLCFK
ncbi:MAG: carotenoid biosynthesis protein [Bacteroidia bacterium]|nr:carotenoid biosynthesis protein [Bacteroidia bacterium]